MNSDWCVKPAMPLPTCTKVEGRYIGRLLTFAGDIKWQRDDNVVEEPATDFVTKIRWSGRLWRDPVVPQGVALALTIAHVTDWRGLTLVFPGAGFGLFKMENHRVRIDLIGVVPEARSTGVARALVMDAVGRLESNSVIAGTYEDNEPAKRLYHGLGMKPIKTEHVFHR